MAKANACGKHMKFATALQTNEAKQKCCIYAKSGMKNIFFTALTCNCAKTLCLSCKMKTDGEQYKTGIKKKNKKTRKGKK